MHATAVLLTSLAFLVASTVRADYSPPPLNDLVLGSDAIVVGRIVALGERTFTFEVATVVAGALPGPRIEVFRFVDWTCAARWAPYAVGQEALLFLDRVEGGTFAIRSGGGEGEMPIDGDRVLIQSFYAEMAPLGAERFAAHTIHGGRYVGPSAPLADVVAALRSARECFSAERSHGPYRRIERVHVTCSEAVAGAARRTPIGASLFPALAP